MKSVVPDLAALVPRLEVHTKTHTVGSFAKGNVDFMLTHEQHSLLAISVSKEPGHNLLSAIAQIVAQLMSMCQVCFLFCV